MEATRAEKWATAIGTVKLVRLVGFRRADELIGFVADWKAFILGHGRAPDSFEEYLAWTTRYPRRTAFRRLALLRETFGPEVTPTDLVRPWLEQIENEIGEER